MPASCRWPRDRSGVSTELRRRRVDRKSEVLRCERLFAILLEDRFSAGKKVSGHRGLDKNLSMYKSLGMDKCLRREYTAQVCAPKMLFRYVHGG